jgi:hypothetical protein
MNPNKYECEICGLYRHGKEEDSTYHSVIAYRSLSVFEDINLKRMLEIARTLEINVSDLAKEYNLAPDPEEVLDLQHDVWDLIMQAGYIPMFWDGAFIVYGPAKTEFNPFNQEFNYVFKGEKELEIDEVLFKLLAYKDAYVEKDYVNR